MRSLEFNKYLPLHVQIKMTLEEEILKGIYDEKIPGEFELMERFSVSRATVRQAVKELVDQGILKKLHGKGTFISFKPVEEWLGSFSTYRQIIENMGMKPYIKLLSSTIASTPQEVAETLGEEEFYNIKRVRYADDNPISIENSYYSLEIGGKLTKFDLNNVGTYNLLENMGIKLWNAKQIITARMPTAEECMLLDMPDTVPVLFIERINFDVAGNTVEYEHSVYRADSYGFVVNLGRSENSV
ncbi:MAG: GntR family transcriptional regulator [Peptococcaceae bacterium]